MQLRRLVKNLRTAFEFAVCFHASQTSKPKISPMQEPKVSEKRLCTKHRVLHGTYHGPHTSINTKTIKSRHLERDGSGFRSPAHLRQPRSWKKHCKIRFPPLSSMRTKPWGLFENNASGFSSCLQCSELRWGLLVIHGRMPFPEALLQVYLFVARANCSLSSCSVSCMFARGCTWQPRKGLPVRLVRF